MNPSGMRVDEQDDHGVRVIGLHGRLDLPGAATVLRAVSGRGDLAPQAVVLDLAELVEPVEPRLLMIFPAAQRRIGRWPEHEVRLAGASTPVVRQLHRLGIGRFVTIDPTLTGALDELCTGRPSRRSTHVLASLPGSPGRARRCVDDLLARVPDRVRETAALVTSELTTNVLRHVHEPFTLSLTLLRDELLVAVTDADRHLPAVRQLTMDGEGGRGLYLIETLSQAWGVRLIYRGGKTVWSRIATVA